MRMFAGLELHEIDGLTTFWQGVGDGVMVDGTKFKLGMAVNGSALFVFTELPKEEGKAMRPQYMLKTENVLTAMVHSIMRQHGISEDALNQDEWNLAVGAVMGKAAAADQRGSPETAKILDKIASKMIRMAGN